MTSFDLGLAFVWEYDEDFINLLEKYLQKDGLTTYRIGYYNLKETYDLLLDRKLSFQILSG